MSGYAILPKLLNPGTGRYQSSHREDVKKSGAGRLTDELRSLASPVILGSILLDGILNRSRPSIMMSTQSPLAVSTSYELDPLLIMWTTTSYISRIRVIEKSSSSLNS
jgi:hypothetical protein